MISSRSHDFASEFYNVEKVVELVADYHGTPTFFRLEAVESSNGNWSIHGYIKKSFKLNPTFSEDGESEPKTGEYDLWVPFPVPSLFASTIPKDADKALEEGLLFLNQDLSKTN